MKTFPGIQNLREFVGRTNHFMRNKKFKYPIRNAKGTFSD